MTETNDAVAEVALAIPLHTTLSYQVPGRLLPLVQPGVRVRVPIGPRRAIGLVTALSSAPQGDRKLKHLHAVLDLEPVLTADLLELGRFVADYYLAPIGEVLHGMVPPSFPSAEAERVELTDRGALAPPAANHDLEALLAVLRQEPRQSLAQLAEARIDLPIEALVRNLEGRGLVRVRRRGTRTRMSVAYELSPDPLEDSLERCGRSQKGQAAVRYLSEIKRPASQDELLFETGSTDAVLRRLVQKGILRRYEELRRLSLDRHVLRAQDPVSFELTEEQARALAHIDAALDSRTFTTFLIHGVTGSGKTELYLRAIESVLKQGRGAIVLVPEIALVPASAHALRGRFGELVALLHSALGRSEREQEWRRIRSGEARIVVGARSAIFAPLANCGLIVVDEEHDTSYKQDIVPRYHARDLALVRAQAQQGLVLLGTATPALESRFNAARGRYRLLTLRHRVRDASLPEGVLVDLRRQPFPHRPGEVHFSEVLCDEIRGAFERGEQMILLRNRRGYAPVLLCRGCGEDLRCEDCGLPRTLHRRPRAMLCHYCGSRLAVPRRCATCGEEALEAVGAGTQRVEEQFRELFPEIAVGVLDRDVAQRMGGATEVLERFRAQEIQALVGTQMVAKGHHFPNVSLTAVLSADSYLGFPDFRAVERTYNLLTQVAGRAGRGEAPGKVLIQTHYPEHYAIRAALEHDDRLFEAEEMRFREIFHYPPFSRAVLLLVEDRARQRAEDRIQELARAIESSPDARGVRVAGPAPAPLEKLRGKWRFQLLMRARSSRMLRRLVRSVAVIDQRAVSVIDIDPYSLL